MKSRGGWHSNHVSHTGTHDQSISRLVNLTETSLSSNRRGKVSRNEPGGFPFVCPENVNGEICFSVSQKLNAPRIDGRQSKLDAREFIPRLAYPEGHMARDRKDASFRSTSLCPKSFRSYRREFPPFSLLTVHLPDHNSKYFAKMSTNIHEDRSSLLRTGYFIF